MSHLQSQWDSSLTNLSQSMVPSEDALHFAKSTANRLFCILENNSKYKIDRPMIMGSIGKKTAIKVDYDYDCDIFVNDVLYKDFKDIKSDFEDVILLSNLKVEHVRDTKVALQLTIEGMEFDIVPAVNFRENNKNFEQQRERAMAFIRRLPNPVQDGWKYGSSMVEWQVKFIKRQSAFTHDLIRLAKYWNKTLFVAEYIQGRSSLIELIATYAANNEEKRYGSGLSMLRAFKGFLNLIANFDRLEVVFEMFYNRSEVEVSISRQKPLVVDPSNPYLNCAYTFVKSPDLMRKFQGFAKASIERLEQQVSSLAVNLECVFQVQPSIAPPQLVSHSLPMANSEILVGTEDCNKIKAPNMIVRNEAKFKGKGLAINIIQYYLWNNIKIVEAGNFSRAELQNILTGIIDCNIYGLAVPRRWYSADDKHSSYDLTFEIPCGQTLIRLSLNFP